MPADRSPFGMAASEGLRLVRGGAPYGDDGKAIDEPALPWKAR
jgi:hypothetical protein